MVCPKHDLNWSMTNLLLLSQNQVLLIYRGTALFRLRSSIASSTMPWWVHKYIILSWIIFLNYFPWWVHKLPNIGTIILWYQRYNRDFLSMIWSIIGGSDWSRGNTYHQVLPSKVSRVLTIETISALESTVLSTIFPNLMIDSKSPIFQVHPQLAVHRCDRREAASVQSAGKTIQGAWLSSSSSSSL